MAKLLRFDLFSGSPTKDPVWLESVEDIASASERIKQLSRSHPGPYFVYSCHTSAVVARVDSSAKAKSA